jgi:hypothetical protein
MKFHLPDSINEILWALTFAGYLVLLVVLMGRDRVKRFPWFTATSVLIAFRLLSAKMLYGHLAQIPMAAMFIGLALLGALVNVGVLMELARKGFAGIKRAFWVAGALVLLGIGAVVLATWGEWPAWQTITAGGGIIANLQLLQLIALKSSLLIDVETVLLGLTIVLFGRRFHAGWKTHIQRIAIGLAVVSLAQLASEAIVQILARTAHPHSADEYQHLMDLRDRIFYANSAVLVLALIWWIACLWKNEPGNESGSDVPSTTTPALPPASDDPDATISQPE